MFNQSESIVKPLYNRQEHNPKAHNNIFPLYSRLHQLFIYNRRWAPAQEAARPKVVEESQRPPSPSLVLQRPVFSSPSEESLDSSRQANTPSVSAPELRSISPPFSSTSPLRYNFESIRVLSLLKSLVLMIGLDSDRCWSLLETRRGITRRRVLCRGTFSSRWGTMRSWVSFWELWRLLTVVFCPTFIPTFCLPRLGRTRETLDLLLKSSEFHLFLFVVGFPCKISTLFWS